MALLCLGVSAPVVAAATSTPQNVGGSWNLTEEWTGLSAAAGHTQVAVYTIAPSAPGEYTVGNGAGWFTSNVAISGGSFTLWTCGDGGTFSNTDRSACPATSGYWLENWSFDLQKVPYTVKGTFDEHLPDGSVGFTGTFTGYDTTPPVQAALTVAVSAPNPTLHVGTEEDVSATVAATGGDVTGISLGQGLAASSDVAVVSKSPSGLSGFDLSDGSSKTFTFTVKGTKEGSVDLSLTASGTGPSGSVSDSDQVTLKVSEIPLIVNTSSDKEIDPKALDGDPPVCSIDLKAAQQQCSLRAAIQLVDKLGGAQTITFDIPGGGVPKIAVPFDDRLPAITATVAIDGTTQDGGWVRLSSAQPLSGHAIVSGGSDSGLALDGQGSSVRGFVINGFSWGVWVKSSGDHVAGDRIGTSPDGEVADPNAIGVYVTGPGAEIGGTSGTSASSCTGDCDLISGNTISQLWVDSGGGDAVQGDTIGADLSGDRLLTFQGKAPGIEVQAAHVTIGGPVSAPGQSPGNVIGSTNVGVDFGSARNTVSADVSDDVVAGNLIGVARSGTHGLRTTDAGTGPPDESSAFPKDCPCGIVYEPGSGTAGPLIGGTSRDYANVISGWERGVYLDDSSTTRQDTAVIDNDLIGTDASGTAPIQNGIGVVGHNTDTPESNFFHVTGGSVLDSVVSGNDVGLYRIGVVQGDLIGTNLDGTAAVPNVVGAADSLTVGGPRAVGSTSCAFPCDLISGNLEQGVFGARTVQGNFIGTNLDGTSAVPNGTGMAVEDATLTSFSSGAVVYAATVGGPSGALRGVCDQACNLISGNNASGIVSSTLAAIPRPPGLSLTLDMSLVGLPASNNELLVQGNQIGRSITNQSLPNTLGGVIVPYVRDSSETIGGDADDGNVIADNSGPAVWTTNDLDEERVRTVPVLGYYRQRPSVPVVEGNSIVGNKSGIIYPDRARAPGIPVISGVTASNGQPIVSGHATKYFTGKANLVRIDVYGNKSCNPNAQGETPLGWAYAGPLSADWVLKMPPNWSAYPYLTATATAPADGGTSEFSSCFAASSS